MEWCRSRHPWISSEAAHSQELLADLLPARYDDLVSYDLYLAPREAVEALIAHIDDLGPDDEVLNPGLPHPETEKRKREVAEALVRENAELTPFQFGFSEIASFTESPKRKLGCGTGTSN